MKLNHIICSNQHVTMTDYNYQQVFNYFRHCYFLTQSLRFEDRQHYLSRMNELLQETWYDFIWRTDLSSELLVKMQAAKENLLAQSLGENFSSKLVSGEADGQTNDRKLIWLITLILLAFIIVAICLKFILSSTLKSRTYVDDGCRSEIDIRRMNLEPPKISPCSSDNRIVYYVSHFFTIIEERRKECCIPSQVHIKMCCSHEGQDPHRSAADRHTCKCHGRNNFYSKIIGSCWGFFHLKFCKKCQETSPARTWSLCLTSSGVSMSEEFIPVFTTVRQMRIGNDQKPSEIIRSRSLVCCKSDYLAHGINL